MRGFATITLVFTVRPHGCRYIHSAVKDLPHVKKNNQTINIQLRNLTYVKRPYQSFIYPPRETVVCNWEASRWIHTLAKAVSGLADPDTLPDTKQRSISSCCQSSRMSPSPARNTGWQQPASCSMNLLQHRRLHMYMFVYTACTQGKKSAKTAFPLQSRYSHYHIFDD